MFYYYGRKKKIAKLYPNPIYDTIIESFAGSAAYSLHGDNWKKKVILIEKDVRVASVWKWLINVAQPEYFYSFPDLEIGQFTTEFLHILHAVTKGAFGYRKIKVTPILKANWNRNKKIMAESLHKIKHWEIIQGDYTEAPDIEATWFIDPPYKGFAGLGYSNGSDKLNYTDLTKWIQSRKGEVICCEGEFGDYLPFESLTDLKSVAGKSSKEVIYYNRNI